MNNLVERIKEFFKVAINFILKYGKYFYPGFALVLAAITVVVGLNVKKLRDEKLAAEEAERVRLEELAAQQEFEENGVPLVAVSDDDKLHKFFEDYFFALSNGNSEFITASCSGIEESEVIRAVEQSNYLNYSLNELYSQVGPEEGMYIVYAYSNVIFDEYLDISLPSYLGFFVKSNENGFYIEMGGYTDDELKYIDKVASQDDVVEFKNRVNVDYNDAILEHPEILDYLVSLDESVSSSVGEKIAQLNAASMGDGDTEENETEAEPIVVTLYATATTDVNVRASDSTGSDRVGEAKKGERYEVIEEFPNGWTKIKFGDQEAFIKSEYLTLTQSADGFSTIGMITADKEVSIRILPDQNSERLGALVKNDQLELVAVEGDWCTVKYNGMIGYVIKDGVKYTTF